MLISTSIVKATNKFIYDLINDGLNASYMDMLIVEFSSDSTTILSYVLDRWFDSRFESIDDADWYSYELQFIELFERLKDYIRTDLKLQKELLKELNGKAVTSSLLLKISVISILLYKINKTDSLSSGFINRLSYLIDDGVIDLLFDHVFGGTQNGCHK